LRHSEPAAGTPPEVSQVAAELGHCSRNIGSTVAMVATVVGSSG
jgi:hypothetical protein